MRRKVNEFRDRTQGIRLTKSRVRVAPQWSVPKYYGQLHKGIGIIDLKKCEKPFGAVANQIDWELAVIEEDAKVAGANLHGIFIALVNLALLAGVAFYSGLVLLSFRTEGLHPRPHIDWRDPVYSAGRLPVWLGVKALALAVEMAVPVFGMLSEASAEVGEWFLSRRHHELP
jgi:hypothetical protein